MMKVSSGFIRGSAKIVCAVVWIAAAVTTHVPGETFEDVPLSDVTLHFSGYLGLAGVFLLTLRLHGVCLSRRVLIALPVLLVYAALDEFTQPLVNRCASLVDWIANALSIFTAVALDAVISLLQRFREKR